MRFFVWLLRAFLFFALFAFALNNSQEASVRWFFGHEWRAPQVIIVLLDSVGKYTRLGDANRIKRWLEDSGISRHTMATAPVSRGT